MGKTDTIRLMLKYIYEHLFFVFQTSRICQT